MTYMLLLNCALKLVEEIFHIFVRDTYKLAPFEKNASSRPVVNLRRCSLFLYHYGNLM